MPDSSAINAASYTTRWDTIPPCGENAISGAATYIV
jgi:hypothetical protein